MINKEVLMSANEFEALISQYLRESHATADKLREDGHPDLADTIETAAEATANVLRNYHALLGAYGESKSRLS